MVFISSLNVPLGYETPLFPGLYWALSGAPAKYLYYPHDIWVFTIYWALIFFLAAYIIVGCGCAASMALRRSRMPKLVVRTGVFAGLEPLLVAALYALMGAVQGAIAGTIIGVILAILYRAGSLTMNVWVPFCWGLAAILYHISSSYSTSLLLL
ncbi:hypothetical protein METBIDRAFT_46439 [Metschnikowia bicuspidata var. bicuspidata NRRL YB-4993]|uniref:Uncharacterized protein n=1 Tax=Metschnikowia bicuspidata var. bicuspidata NRRL YB-4993 TaxID=869754 RepID=A0A1A0H5F6_9ASCO|nr:hypothetical protein METBIDRAFT_46439 [Metschnikowia bicuspidata var. bicuspidata NRRL YB-4993]OBA19175.1 hypothetical protein METBIDRAFT_46439 [Metschnikowia bicuspidata var. bicuspidata NRRL YB-4993]